MVGLRDELAKADKLDTGLQKRIALLPPETADKTLMTVFVRAAGLPVKDSGILDPRGRRMAGIIVRGVTGGVIYTVETDLRGLRVLHDDRRVDSIGGGQVVKAPQPK